MTFNTAAAVAICMSKAEKHSSCNPILVGTGDFLLRKIAMLAISKILAARWRAKSMVEKWSAGMGAFITWLSKARRRAAQA